MKVETPLDSPLVTVINPDDQPMWSSIRTVVPTPSSAIIQLPIPNIFFIKGTHMHMIRDIQFDGRIQSDPHRHVVDFLEISNIFQYGENQEEVVNLRPFPFSLSGEAKTWLNELDEGTITSWNKLREAFVSRYFSLAKSALHLLRTRSNQRCDNSNILSWFKQSNTRSPRRRRNIPLQKLLKFSRTRSFSSSISRGGSKRTQYETIVSAGEGNVCSNHVILMKKFKALATRIDSKFLKIRGDLKDIRDGRKDNHDSHIYMSDDTSIMPHPSQYFQMPKALTNEMMREWMAILIEANENMKNQFLEKKIQRTNFLPDTTKPKSGQDVVDGVYKPPSNRNENDKGDVEFIKENETQPIPIIQNSKLINSNSLTVSPFLKDCTMHIPYTHDKKFKHDVLSNHVRGRSLINLMALELGD
ncbi:reverse transcriptase domain-containing protein [Tanacetum coccineum]